MNNENADKIISVIKGLRISDILAGQEYVDNIFYNLNNDYEMVTLNRSVWDVWKTPINAKYNYWGYNESVAVAGRIKGTTYSIFLSNFQKEQKLYMLRLSISFPIHLS